MTGHWWDDLLKALTNSIKQIYENNNENKLSIVNFSSSLKLEAEKADPSTVIPNNFEFLSGGSFFNKPLEETLRILNFYGDEMKYHIVLMSDGDDEEYPIDEMNELKKIKEEFKHEVAFDCIEFNCSGTLLGKMAKFLGGSIMNTMTFENLNKAYYEIVKKDIDKLN